MAPNTQRPGSRVKARTYGSNSKASVFPATTTSMTITVTGLPKLASSLPSKHLVSYSSHTPNDLKRKAL